MSIIVHPLRAGVTAIIAKHFAEPIAKRFDLIFEGEKFDPNANLSTWRQQRDGNLILQVYYINADETRVFICDIYSWWKPAEAEYALLKSITHKVKKGHIGKDWAPTSDGSMGKEVSRAVRNDKGARH